MSMVDDHEIEGAAAGASELLLDFGTYLTGGRRPNRALVAGAWFLTLVGGLALWRWFAWLFDHLPGWAVMAGGGWMMLLIVSLGLFAATVKYGPSSQKQDPDLPASDRRT